MFKGTTMIELTDVTTGQVDVYEDTNMVTNALYEIMRPMGYAHDPSTILGFFSGISTILGGIILFDSTLEESVDNYYAPTGVNAVACGVYNMQNTTTGTQRGHYNVSESEIDRENGMVKMVWDFQTAQGNGVIKSVSLTSLVGGYCGYGSMDATGAYTGSSSTSSVTSSIGSSSGSSAMRYASSGYTGGNCAGRGTSIMTVGVTEFFYALDPANDVALYFRVESDLQKITIIKRRAWLRSVSVFHAPMTSKPVVETIEYTLDSVLSTTGRVTYNFDEDENILTIFLASATSKANGTTFDCVQIDFNTDVTTVTTITNETGETIMTTSASLLYHRGEIFLRGSVSPHNIYSFPVSNTTDITLYEQVGTATETTVAIDHAIKGRVYMCGISAYRIIDMASQTVMRTEHTRGTYNTSNTVYSVPVLGYPLYRWFEYESGTSSVANQSIPQHYLGTINNLSSPVEKTEDKTMKITYVIQKADD